MAHKILIVALGMIAAASPVSATSPEPTPKTIPSTEPPGTKYCMWIEAITGTRVESVWCWTREEWSEQGVDVDKAWPKDGYKIIT